MTRPIPIDDRGYAVDPSGIVHSRYAAHATGLQRTRTFVGVMSIAGGKSLEPCDVCYPPPPPPRKRPTVATNAGEPVGEVRPSAWRRQPDPEVAPEAPVDEAAEILPEPETE